MHGRIRLYDYRCFRREAPATLEIGPGFTSFIGANNSGKTSLLRSLFEMRIPINRISEVLLSATIPQISGGGQTQTFMSGASPFPEEIITDRTSPETRVEFILDELPQSGRHLRKVSILPHASGYQVEFETDDGVAIMPSNVGGRRVIASGQGFLSVEEIGRVSSQGMTSFLQLLGQSMYIGSFRNPVNAGGGGQYFDVAVGTDFISAWFNWQNGSRESRVALEALTGLVARLMGFSSFKVSASPPQNTLFTVIDGRHGKLSDLGSGISHILITLANVMMRRPSFIVIDEPETGLHPRLQRDFLDVLGAQARSGVLFTTHSMGLARNDAQRCFTVHREGEDSKIRPYEKTGHLAEVLGSMGIAAIQDLAYSRLLLVEGVTEVKVFRHFLARYGLGQDTIVLSLGGSTLINGKVADELSEVLRICPDTRAVVDSERSASGAVLPKDRSGFADICSSLSIPCCVTERRATDNYFSQRAIDEVFGAGRMTQLAPYEKLSGQWGKTDNWRLAAATTREDLDRTDIGVFLAEWAAA
jgi:AAA domain, putative AbiEii toxin, Type IV TA system